LKEQVFSGGTNQKTKTRGRAKLKIRSRKTKERPKNGDGQSGLSLLLVGAGLANNPRYTRTFVSFGFELSNAFTDILTQSQLDHNCYGGLVITETMSPEPKRNDSQGGREGVLRILQHIKDMPDDRRVPVWVLVTDDPDEAWKSYSGFDFVQQLFPLRCANAIALALEVKTWFIDQTREKEVERHASNSRG